jgi:hypothetical protein
LPINGSLDQPFLSSGWPTKWLPQILPSIINNRVSLKLFHFGFVLSPFWYFSYSFSLGVIKFMTVVLPRTITFIFYRSYSKCIQCITFLKYRGFSPFSPFSPSKCGMNFLATISKTFRAIISEETLGILSITSFIYMIISCKTRSLLNSYMGVHFSSFNFKNSTESFISMLLKKLRQLKLVYRSLSLDSHITFDSL